MVRMMMWSPKEGDKRFIETMHDFVKTNWLKPATTRKTSKPPWSGT